MDVGLVYRRSRAEAEDAAEAVRGLGRRAVTCSRPTCSEPDDCARVVNDTVARWAASTCSSTWRPSTAKSRSRRSRFRIGKARWPSISERRGCAPARRSPHMRQLRGGRIINFSDWVARSGRPRYPGFLTYYVAKAGVVALTESLALELAADQILVNAIAPGPIVAPEETTDDAFSRRRTRHPARPLGRRARNRQDGRCPDRQRLHHRGNHQGGWRKTRQVTRSPVYSLRSPGAESNQLSTADWRPQTGDRLLGSGRLSDLSRALVDLERLNRASLPART